MEEIKTTRVHGWLALNIYFTKRLGTSWFDRDDLEERGIIERINEGVNDKFWILSEEGEHLALFKGQQDVNQAYAELISEEICKILGIRTAHYDLAIFDGKQGIISYDFMQEFDSYDSGFDVIADFYENNLIDNQEMSNLYGIDDNRDSIEEVVTKLNNLEDIWAILENRYRDAPNKQEIVSNILDQLVDVLLLDILTTNVDRHCDNWGIVHDGDKLMVAPLFDNERILGLYRTKAGFLGKNGENLNDKNLLFTTENSLFSKPFEVLNHFLDVSSNEYQDRVKEKVSLLQNGIDSIPESIEKRTEYPMPENIKNYFLDAMHDHLERVSNIVEGKNKSYK